MSSIELNPSLTSCIESEAKREYRETLRKLLAAEDETPELKARFELLRAFLERADFGQLRADYEKRLLEGRKVKFTIYMEKGEPRYSVEISSP